jgi:phage RecT family recombinase
MANTNLVIKEKDIQSYLKENAKSIQNYYSGSNVEDFLRSALMVISENKNLMECLKTNPGKASLRHALKFAANTGLSLNPQEGKAALIAYNGQVTYQVMKNGLIDLAMDSKKVEFITADTVRENDSFDIKKTMNGDTYEYGPARKDRGKIDGFFSALKMKDGTCHVKYMTMEEIEAHRDQYSAMYRNKKEASPWHKSFEGMALKTVIKALFRNLSISSDIDRAVGADDKSESGEMRDVTEPDYMEAEPVTAEQTAEAVEKKEEEIQPDPKEDESKQDMF